MKGWKELGTGGRTAVGAAAAAVLAAVVYFGWQARQPAKAPEPPATASAPAPKATSPEASAEAPTAKTGAPAVSSTTTAAAPPPKAAPGTEAQPAPAAPAETAAQAPAKAPAASPPAGPPAPAFDVVRVSPDGNALIAGRAAPGASVDVLIDDAKTASGQASSGGKFVVQFDLAPAAKPRVATLQEVLKDGTKIASSQSVIIAPTSAGTAVASIAKPEAGSGSPAPATGGTEAAGTASTAPPAGSETASAAPAGGGASTEAAAAPGAPPAPGTETAAATPPGAGPATAPPAPSTGAAPQVATAAPAAPGTAGGVAAGTAPGGIAAPSLGSAPTVLLAGKQGVKVLQQGGPNVAMGVDSITYSGGGKVELSGHGTADAHVRIYLDNKNVATAKVGADGRWSLTLPEVHEGLYKLRADELDAKGKVTARFETPFKRESEAALAAAGVTPGGKTAAPSVGVRATIITVQPGYTLWGIAKASYGHGILYVKVFDANREQIRDPDLIYPGQVFSVPGAD